MSTLDLKYYKGSDIYSDGSIEDKLLYIADNNIDVFKKTDISYPELYHFSPLRECILNWYPFTNEDIILEVGAGCGAITRGLCNNAKHVTCVDLSLKRSTINYNRHKDIENLDILVGNLNDMSFNEKFDYIILNGVLEYAGKFTQGETPFHEFIKNSTEFLKDSGKVFISIENRIGLKYFAGAPEDHTGIYFDGINNYPVPCGIRTFSKTELTTLLNECGLKSQKFYYPYPDYKFPREIFTDKSIASQKYGKNFLNFNERVVDLFSTSNVYETLREENIASYFVNSFLVEASKNYNDKNLEIDYVKSNIDRNKQFRFFTAIISENNKSYVIKKPYEKNDVLHLKQMMEIPQLLNTENIVYLPYNFTNSQLYIEYTSKTPLEKILEKYLNENNKEKIKEIIYNFFNAYFINEINCKFKTDEFAVYFGDDFGTMENEAPCIDPANIDMIMSNIFYENNKFYIIDYEWVLRLPVPVEYIKWRFLNDFYYSFKKVTSLFLKEELLIEFGVDIKNEEVFINWETNFSQNYVGNNSQNAFGSKTTFVDLSSFARIYKSKLFLDYGNGFNEQDVIVEEYRVNDDNEFEIKFIFNDFQKLKQIRFDPVEMHMCKCHITECSGKIIAINSYKKDGDFDIFFNLDPQYLISDIDKTSDEITIKGQLVILETIHALNELNDLNTELNCIKNSRTWKLKTKLDKFKREHL